MPNLRDQQRRIRFCRKRDDQPVSVQHVGTHENRLLVKLEQFGQVHMSSLRIGQQVFAETCSAAAGEYHLFLANFIGLRLNGSVKLLSK